MKIRHILCTMLTAICSVFLIQAVPVSADMGPKPSVTVHIENPPAGEYLVDFLINEKYAQKEYTGDDPAELAIRSFHDGEWVPRLRGDVGHEEGPVKPDENDTVYFFYMVPDYFRIIVADSDGKTYVSNALNPIAFNAEVTFDAAAGTLTENAISGDRLTQGISSTVMLFLLTCFLTILTEGIVMLLFFLKMRGRDWGVFLLTQIGTQLLLYAAIIILNFRGDGGTVALMIMIAEPVIAVTEMGVYLMFMKVEKRGRLAVAALISNTVSAVLGFIPFVWIVVRSLRAAF